MKKIRQNSKMLLVLLLALSFSTTWYACSKSEESFTSSPSISSDVMSEENFTLSPVAISSLKSDVRFISALKDNMIIIKRTKNSKELIALVSKESHSKLDLERISILLGFKNFDDYAKFVKKQDTDLLQLKKEYQLDKVSQDVIQQAAMDAMSPKKISSVKLVENSLSSMAGGEGDSDLCEQIRTNCLVNVAAIATAAHIACVAADLTVALGVLCHAAAVAYQASAGNTCNLEAQQCREAAS